MIVLKNDITNFTKIIRKALNKCNYLDNDFSGWCEAGSILMNRLIAEKYQLTSDDNYIVKGVYNGNGHYWNVIKGTIVDTTIDQFGKIKSGIIENRYLKNYEQK